MLVEALPSTAIEASPSKDLSYQARSLINSYILKLLGNTHFREAIDGSQFFQQNSHHRQGVFKNGDSWCKVHFDAGKSSQDSHLIVEKTVNRGNSPEKTVDLVCRAGKSSYAIKNGGFSFKNNSEAQRQILMFLEKL